jgi:hypothetical protein
MKRALVAGTLALVLVPALAGCTAGPPGDSTPGPGPTPAPSPAAGPLAECDDLVSGDDREKFQSAGWKFTDNFEQRMADEHSHLVDFVDYGGALCQWGYPNSDAAEVFAGAPIDKTQQAEQRGYLETQGFALDQHNGADRYTLVVNDGFEEVYLFVDGYWFYGSSASIADRARQNADVG